MLLAVLVALLRDAHAEVRKRLDEDPTRIPQVADVFPAWLVQHAEEKGKGAVEAWQARALEFFAGGEGGDVGDYALFWPEWICLHTLHNQLFAVFNAARR